jgi:restriction system protein
LMAKKQSDRYIRFYGPILDALRALGGSATPKEVKAWILEQVRLSEEDLSRTLKSGDNAVENEIAWARDSLKRFGLLDPSIRGVWSLTPEGERTHLSLVDSRRLRDRHAFPGLALVPPLLIADAAEEPAPPAPTLLETILALPPKGFERLCQRILREAGFSEVHVTGQSGDGGIDGHGILQVNELVSFRVLFQCKRYQGSVGSGAIRDFRGAMTGRTDKGIIITTGTFSNDAEKEAVRDGAPPVELVNGKRLVELMERLRLGVAPRTVYDVDGRFFEEFRQN